MRPVVVKGSVEQKAESVRARMASLHRAIAETPPEERSVLGHTFDDLRDALEELEVAEEELRQQNEQLMAAQLELGAERERFQELFEFAPDGYLVTDTHGVIREANYAASRMLGQAASRLIGKPLAAFVPVEDRRTFRQGLIGLGQSDRVHGWMIRIRPHERAALFVDVTATTVRDRSGRRQALRWLLRDVTARQKTEDQIRTLNANLERRVAERTAELERADRTKDELLHRAQEAQAAAESAAKKIRDLQSVTDAALAHLDPDDLLRELFPRIRTVLAADAVAVFLFDEQRGGLIERASVGFEPEDSRRCAGIAKRLEVTRKPSAVINRERRGAAADRGAGVQSLLSVPLRVGERIVGTLNVGTKSPRRFTEDDIRLMQLAAERLAGPIHRARLYEREHRIAGTLQSAFLPDHLPVIPGLRINVSYVPGAAESEVGGDWYDVFQKPDGRLVISIGDVEGEGLQAAVTMGQVRQAIRAAVLDDESPGNVLSRTALLLQFMEPETLVTAVLGIIDPSSSILTYANAGHPPPIVGRPDGAVEVLSTHGLPLGIPRLRRLTDTSVQLVAGSLLVLYTDGLTEHKRSLMQGHTELTAAVQAELLSLSSNAAESIQRRVLSGKRPADDVALLSVYVDPVHLDRLELVLSARPQSLAVIRRAVGRAAAAADLALDTIQALQVAVGEAATNVIEHAYGTAEGTIHIRAFRRDTVYCVEVEDHGQWRNAPHRSAGRGIPLMHGMVKGAEIERRAAGTLVRFSVPLMVDETHA